MLHVEHPSFPDTLRRLASVVEGNPLGFSDAFAVLDGNGSVVQDPLYLSPPERQQLVTRLAQRLGLSPEEMLMLYSAHKTFSRALPGGSA